MATTSSSDLQAIFFSTIYNRLDLWQWISGDGGMFLGSDGGSVVSGGGESAMDHGSGSGRSAMDMCWSFFVIIVAMVVAVM